MKNEIEIRVNQEIEKFLSDPINIIKAYEKALSRANEALERMAPKEELYDITMGSKDLMEMSAVSKILNFRNMGSKNLFAYLRSKGILRYNNEPYQQHVDAKLFKVIEQIYYIHDNPKINRKPMCTDKGIKYIGKLLLEDGYALNER